MLHLLEAIYHDTLPDLQVFCDLEEPRSPEEKKLAVQLRAVEEQAAEALKPSITALAEKQAERSFYMGVRVGAQLMVQLLERPQ